MQQTARPRNSSQKISLELSHFLVLSDADRRVVKAYGVYVWANLESINIARPSNFALDPNGVIRFMHIASVQVEHASFDEILSALDDRG